MTTATRSVVAKTWADAWPDAVARWSRYARLRPPVLCESSDEAAYEGLIGSFAMIRLADKQVVIDLELIRAHGLVDYAPEILSHEVGHHIVAPATAGGHARLLARTRWGLPGIEDVAPLVANIYADLLINDRLQRSHRLRLDEVYAAVQTNGHQPSSLWDMLHRCFEILWSKTRGTLAPLELDPRTEGDAELCARLVRVYGRDWLDGSGRFAALCLPYITQDEQAFKSSARRWYDMEDASAGSAPPAGLSNLEPGEGVGDLHPSKDPRLNGSTERAAEGDSTVGPSGARGAANQHGQARNPFEYGQLFRALGLDLTDHEAAVRWYREQALPHLVPFPSHDLPTPTDELPEGFEAWENGDEVGLIDWAQSIFRSPIVVPGVTTVKRVYGRSAETEFSPEPLHLDIYVDSSGSMPNPQWNVSYPALAGTVLALSALRAGARVQATLWSGSGQFETTGGFTADGEEILRVITGHIGGSTQFPLHILRDTYIEPTAAGIDRAPTASFRFTGDESTTNHRPSVWQGHRTHVVVISDDGVDTMLGPDERGNPGADVVGKALAAAGGGGTLVLDLGRQFPPAAELAALGWVIEPVTDLAGLVEVARRFAHREFGAA